MKAAVLVAHGLDNLHLRDLPDPRPGHGEVLVRMRAASLNYRDLVTIEGGYGSRQRHENLIVASDGAGEIAEVGAGVTGWKVGDRVVACFAQDWIAGPPDAERLAGALGGKRDGVACELRALPATGVVPMPASMSFTEAATLPCAALTAWNAVIGQSGTRPGDVVLTQGSGGVSVFALQFAHAAGAKVIATSSSPAKLARLAELGATELIDYTREPEWGRHVVALTAGKGADLVVEVGGAQTLKQSMIAVRVGGTMAMIGVVSGARTEINLGPLVTRHVRMLGITVGSRDALLEMIRAIELHRIRPVIDRVFPLRDIREALLHLRSGRHFGKVCLEI